MKSALRTGFGIPFAIFLLVGAGAPCFSAQEAPTSHKPLRVGAETIVAGEGDDASTIEDVTRYCLGCHAPDDAATAATPVHPVGSMDLSHPVDVPYPAEGRDYVPVDQLDSNLRLVDGRMVCITCHDPTTLKHDLTIANEQSRLCVACHLR